MDWNAIILALLSTTTVGGLVGMIIYRKQNKKLKENEVKMSDANTQTEQINLGELFMQKAADMFKQMQDMQEQTYMATLQNGKDNTDIITEVREVKEQVRCIASEQKNIVTYLNGNYQEWLKQHNNDNPDSQKRYANAKTV